MPVSVRASLGSSRSLLVAIALLVIIPLAAFVFFSPAKMASPVMVESIATGVGETRVITMPGGSEVRLYENSQLSQRISEEQLRLRLEKGKATFVVMEDSARPFWVLAGAFRLRASTSAFQVSVLENQLILDVFEGRVRAQWAGAAQTFTAGERLEISL